MLDDYSGLYSDLIELIIKISDYIFRDAEKVRKGLGDVMGGKVLELTSERLIEQAEDKSFLLINRLIADGRNDEMLMLHREAYNKIEPKTDHSHYSA